MQRWFSDFNIAVFTLVFMSIQLVWFEGYKASTPKVVFMALTPLLIIAKTPHISKAVILSAFFWIITVSMSLVQYNATRMSTFWYTALFLSTFCLYYNLLYYNKVFTLKQGINIIKFVIYAYAAVLLAQTICILGGIHYFPWINLMGSLSSVHIKASSLAIEPSHTARIMTVYFYAFLKLVQLQEGRPPKIGELWYEHRWVLISFLYIMIGCGSGTAFAGLAIIALYFLKKEYVIWVVLGAFTFYMVVPFLHYEPLERAMNVFNAALTMDTEVVRHTDNSASFRVNILIETFNNFDPMDEKLWLGYGIDQGAEAGVVSGMADYGLISYIAKLALFFGCCFLGLFSLEVLMFILLFMLNIGNIAYGWAALMVFATIKYFYSTYNPDDEDEDEDENEEDIEDSEDTEGIEEKDSQPELIRKSSIKTIKV